MTDPRQVEQALSQLVGHAFSALTEDIARSRQVLQDAVPSLVTSFRGLRDGLQSQSAELERVSQALRGSGVDNKGFLHQIRGVLDVFVNDLVNVSHASMQLVSRVETLGEDVDGIVSHVNQLETLAKTTKLVALNARIEAHRAGESGKTFRVVADEVKTLAEDSAQFSQQIREVVQKAHAGLSDAQSSATQLASHDLNSILSVHNEVLTTIGKLDETNERMASSVHRFHQDVNDAIRAMQFEDIVNQLLNTIAGRLDHVHGVWRAWLLARESDTQRGWAELEAAMGRFSEDVRAHPDVKQDSMTVGTAELF